MVSATQSKLIDALLSPAALQSNISSAIAAKSLDAEKQQGAAVLQLIDAAATTGAQPGDPLTAKATGVGGILDTTA